MHAFKLVLRSTSSGLASLQISSAPSSSQPKSSPNVAQRSFGRKRLLWKSKKVTWQGTCASWWKRSNSTDRLHPSLHSSSSRKWNRRLAVWLIWRTFSSVNLCENQPWRVLSVIVDLWILQLVNFDDNIYKQICAQTLSPSLTQLHSTVLKWSVTIKHTHKCTLFCIFVSMKQTQENWISKKTWTFFSYIANSVFVSRLSRKWAAV